MNLSSPLISCVCLTRNRVSYLSRAIINYQSQSYKSKELIIVCAEEDISSQRILAELEDDSIRVLNVKGGEDVPLGELRNRGIAFSHGAYICQWDDDDWYHADRLKLQLEHILKSGCKGSILGRLIIYDKLEGRAYLSHSRLWEGSVMCEKAVMTAHPYPKLKINEDSAVISELFDKGFLSVIWDHERLYVYIVHGNNTWNREHFLKMLNMCTSFSNELSNKIGQILENVSSRSSADMDHALDTI